MRKMIEVTITNGDGQACTLAITQWGAYEGAANMARLARVLGPVLAPALEAAIKGKTAEIDAKAIVAGLQHVDGAELGSLISSLEKATKQRMPTTMGTKVDAPLNADDFFAGAYSSLLEWLGHGLALNFRDFFSSATLPPAPRT